MLEPSHVAPRPPQSCKLGVVKNRYKVEDCG